MAASASSPTCGAVRNVLLVLGACVAIAAGLLFAWLPPPDDPPDDRGGGPPPALVEAARFETIAAELEALGTVRANEQATISSKISEVIESVHFEDGSLVEKGDLLFQLRAAEQRAELADARAQMLERERQLERVRSVSESGAVSQSALDEEQSRYDSAKARVELFESRVADRRIEAPFGGILGLRRASPGDLVSPGDRLVTLSDLAPVKVDFTAPERYIGRIGVDQRIEAMADAFQGEIFEGRIQAISPVVDSVTRAAQIRATVPNEDFRLRPGMLMRVRVQLGERDALLVPESAINPEGDRHHLFVVDDNDVARRREVSLGMRVGSRVEVSEGLEAQERVVTQGYRVREGQRVQVVEEESVFTTGGGGS